ncbi:hypothetical protein ACQJBY_061999 [Aegilops geniculata]
MNHAPGHSIPEQTADPVVPQPSDGDITCDQRPPDLISHVLDVSPIDGGIHLYTMSTAQVLSQTVSTSEHMTTGSFDNVTKQPKKGILSDEKREQINAKRRTTYRRKKEEEAKKLEHESQAYLSISDQSITEQTAVVVVPESTDGDITRVPRPYELNSG